MRTEGRLRNWNDDRGFGFIVTAETKQDVFVHISSFPHTGRRPQPGERLAFEIESGHDGKRRAIAVSYLDPPTAASLAAPSAKVAHRTTPASARQTPRSADRDRRGDRGRHRGRNRAAAGGQRRFGSVLTLLALCGIGAAIMNDDALQGLLPSPSPTPSMTIDGVAYASSSTRSSTDTSVPMPRCDGRTRCSQMTSCAEARYFLQHCPGVEMDGNHDGEPCEQQWCH